MAFCSTIKYNRRTRLGRGFSLAELKVRTSGSGRGFEWRIRFVKRAVLF
jgi:hypothetical protein